MTSSTDNVARRYFEALGAHDLDAAVACWRPGGVDRLVGSQDLVAPEGIRTYFSELFATRMRYSGVSIGSQLASIVAGALAPLIAVALLDAYDSAFPVMIYMAVAAAITLITVYVSRETKDRDLATLGTPEEVSTTR